MIAISGKLQKISQFIAYFREMISDYFGSIIKINAFLKLKQLEYWENYESGKQKDFNNYENPKQEGSANWFQPKEIFDKTGSQKIN